jgi:hypothetical protein
LDIATAMLVSLLAGKLSFESGVLLAAAITNRLKYKGCESPVDVLMRHSIE